jgi:hypothetical protein
MTLHQLYTYGGPSDSVAKRAEVFRHPEFAHAVFVSRDGQRVVALHPPDSPAIESTNDLGSFRGKPLGPATNWYGLARKRQLVIVERSFERPVTEAQLFEYKSRGDWCFGMYQVDHPGSYLAEDGRQMVCLLEGHDLESVRQVDRTVGVPNLRLWVVGDFSNQSGG